MSSASARAYAGNPGLNQQRAGVRATDENLPRATPAWRLTASANAQYGYNRLDHTLASGSQAPVRANTAAPAYGLTVTQNLFNGNRTVNGVRQVGSNIFGARETLRNTGQNVLQSAATAYLNAPRDTAILDLRKNNIIVREEQLRQTRDRFTVGEVTGPASPRPNRILLRRAPITSRRKPICKPVSPIGVEPTRLSRDSDRAQGAGFRKFRIPASRQVKI